MPPSFFDLLLPLLSVSVGFDGFPIVLIRGIARFLRSARVTESPGLVESLGSDRPDPLRHLFLFLYRIDRVVCSDAVSTIAPIIRWNSSCSRCISVPTILLHLLQPLNLCGCGNRSIFGRLLIGNQSGPPFRNRRLCIFITLLCVSFPLESEGSIRRYSLPVRRVLSNWSPTFRCFVCGMVSPSKIRRWRTWFRPQHVVVLRVLVQHISSAFARKPLGHAFQCHIRAVSAIPHAAFLPPPALP